MDKQNLTLYIIDMYERYSKTAKGREKQELAKSIQNHMSLSEARKIWKIGIVWSVDYEREHNPHLTHTSPYPDNFAVYPVAYRTSPIEKATHCTPYSVGYKSDRDVIVIGEKSIPFYRNKPLVLAYVPEPGHLKTARYVQMKEGSYTLIALSEAEVRGKQFDNLMAGILEACMPNAIMVFGNTLAEKFTGKKVNDSIAQVYDYNNVPLVTLYSKNQIEYTKTQWKRTVTADRDWLFRDNKRSVDRALSIPLSTLPKYTLVDVISPGDTNFVDIETNGLDIDAIITKLQVLVDGGDACQIIEYPSTQQIKDTLNALCGRTIIFHNALFDAPILFKKAGIIRLEDTRIYDTMLISQRRGIYHSNSLKYLSTFTDRRGSNAFGGFESNLYAAEDCFSTRAVWEMLNKEELRPIDKYMSSAIPTFIAQYVLGIRLDKNRLQDTIEDYKYQISVVDRQLSEIATIEWTSTAQLAAWLIEKGYTLPISDKGNPVVSKEVLETLDNDAARLVLERRGLQKTLSHFISLDERSDERGYVHILQDLHGTVSGRSTMAFLQQMSKTGPDRTMVVSDCEDGLVAAVDLSQAELRILAMVSGDEKLRDALLSGDVHKATAALVFNKPLEEVSKAERRSTKTVVFGTVYGASAKGLAARGKGEEKELQFIQDNLKNAYPKAMVYLEAVKERAMKSGMVTDILGKSRSLEQDIFFTNKSRAGRQAGNDVVQGPAGQLALFLHAAIQHNLWTKNANSRVLFNLHDESVISVAQGEEQIVTEAVQAAFWMLGKTKLGKLDMWDILPLTGNLDFGASWGALAEETVNTNIITSVEISTLAKEMTNYE